MRRTKGEVQINAGMRVLRGRSILSYFGRLYFGTSGVEVLRSAHIKMERPELIGFGEVSITRIIRIFEKL